MSEQTPNVPPGSAAWRKAFAAGPPKVLVVDDEYSIRVTFEAFLEREGCNVLCAQSQEEALAILEREPLDLLLLDILLGGDSGMALLERCRELQPDTPVVMVTGRPSLETATAAVRLGAFDYLYKPVERDELLRVAGRALQHKALLDEKYTLQQELQASERRYRLLAENAGDVIWVMDAQEGFSYFSPAVQRMLGFSPEEVLTMGPEHFVEQQPAALAQEWRTWREGVVSGILEPEPRMWEMQAQDSQGRLIWIETMITPLLEEGVCTGFLGVSRDVTQRKEAEQALEKARREKEAYRGNLDATFRSIPDAIVTVDSELRIISLNDAAAKICGEDMEEGAFFANKSLCKDAPCKRVLQRTLEEQQPVRSQVVTCRNTAGGMRHVELNCAPLLSGEEGRHGAVLVVKDVTRLLDLEKQLQQRTSFHGIIGRSPQMQEVFSRIEQLANVDSTVLIQGETGTGKELVCDALHAGGHRASAPLVKVNCSALSESLLESELFGHVRGAFTGAVRDKEGRIQAAAGGTLLLDEIGDLSPLIQLKLLRFLEQKEYERVGESTTRKANVRVITASNVDLQEQVREGRFREDLFYRLNVMVIKLPPLRERNDDISLLVEHFLRHFGQTFGKRFEGCSREALQAMEQYVWPGNVRELKHTLEHACILCQQGVVGLEHLPAAVLESKRQEVLHQPARTTQEVGPREIRAALEQAEGNKAKAARLLGIDRTTLYRKLARYGDVLQ